MINEKIHKFDDLTIVFYYYPEEEVIHTIAIDKKGRKKKIEIPFGDAKMASMFFSKLPQKADFRDKGEKDKGEKDESKNCQKNKR